MDNLTTWETLSPEFFFKGLEMKLNMKSLGPIKNENKIDVYNKTQSFSS